MSEKTWKIVASVSMLMTTGMAIVTATGPQKITEHAASVVDETPPSWGLRKLAGRSTIANEDVLLDKLKNGVVSCTMIEQVGNLSTDKSVAALTTAAAQARGPTIKHCILSALEHNRSSRSIELLEKMLDDRWPDVRKEAADILAHRPEKEAREKLKAVAHGQSAAALDAALALAELGDSSVFEILLRAVRGQHNTRTNEIINALAKYQTDESVDALASVLEYTTQSVRNVIYGALGKIGTEKACQLLEESLEGDTRDSRDIIFTALTHSECGKKILLDLVEIGSRTMAEMALNQLASLEDPSLEPTMIKLVQGTGWRQRIALNYFEQVPPNEALQQALFDQAEHSRDQRTLGSIFRIMARHGGERETNWIFERAKKTDRKGLLAYEAIDQIEGHEEEKRQVHVEALESRNFQRIQIALNHIEEDPSERISEAVAKVLRKSPRHPTAFRMIEILMSRQDIVAKSAVKEMMSKGSPEMRTRIMERLVESGDSAAVEKVIGGIEKNDSMVIDRLGATLPYILERSDKQAERAIKACLKSKNNSLMAHVIPTVIDRRGAKAIPDVNEWLQSTDIGIKDAAFAGLIELDFDQATSHAERMLNSGTVEEQRWALMQMQQSLELYDLGRVKGLIKSDDEGISSAVFALLGLDGSDEANGLVVSVLNDDNAPMTARKNAASMLLRNGEETGDQHKDLINRLLGQSDQDTTEGESTEEQVQVAGPELTAEDSGDRESGDSNGNEGGEADVDVDLEVDHEGPEPECER